LQDRVSAPRLRSPGPSAAERLAIFRAAVRVPDHARLRPWHFLSIEGGGLDQLGDLLLASLLRHEPDASDAARARAQSAPLRAPWLVICCVRYTPHPKVPPREQLLSAGCAAHALLLAAEALGYAGVWRTGAAAEDREFMAALGMADNEAIVGFLYIGTRDGELRTPPAVDPGQHVTTWPPTL